MALKFKIGDIVLYHNIDRVVIVNIIDTSFYIIVNEKNYQSYLLSILYGHRGYHTSGWYVRVLESNSELVGNIDNIGVL
jgi:hypothetical protein